MKNLYTLIFLTLFSYNLFSQKFSINAEKSNIKWTGTELTTKTHFGSLKFLDGNVLISNDQVMGEITVDMESLRNEDLSGEWKAKLEGHLRSDDFFSIDKHKTSSIKIISSNKLSDNKYSIEGILTIKEISHPINFELNIDGRRLFTNLSFDRSKYDVRFRSGSFFENLGDKLILDEIELEVLLILE